MHLKMSDNEVIPTVTVTDKNVNGKRNANKKKQNRYSKRSAGVQKKIFPKTAIKTAP